MAPDRFYARYYIALSLMWLERVGDGLAELRQMPAGDFFRNAGEAILYARAGDRAASDRATAAVAEQGPSVLLTQILAQRGEVDRAVTMLDGIWKERSPDLAALRADPLFNPIRSDARFQRLTAALHFP